MYILLLILGLLPFVAGGLMNWLLMTCAIFVPPLTIITILFLLGWGLIIYLTKPQLKNCTAAVVCLNSAAFIVLILLGIQELVLGAYWPNFVGAWTQFFYLPLLNISFLVTRWSHSLFAAYCAAFIMMVTASVLGWRLRKK